MATKSQKSSSAVPNPGRHASSCRVCMHPERQDIENDFLSWKSPAKIATEYKLRNRASIYRHARAFDLVSKRARNICALLERFMERADDVPVTASAILQASAMLVRLVPQDPVFERNQALNAAFEKMSDQELETYAKEGAQPKWFTDVVSATGRNGQGGKNHA